MKETQRFVITKLSRSTYSFLFFFFCKNRVSLTLNMYFASLKYTSATFVTSVVNTIPSLTFVIALALRWGLRLYEC